MRFAIVGAGAVGGFLGARLIRAGYEVTLVARGPHLEAMRRGGLRVVGDEGEFSVAPRLAASCQECGEADYVVLAVKAHALPALAPQLGPVLGPASAVVSTQNGVPWWFPDPPLDSVDPGGVIAAAIDRRRVIGSIVYFATELVEPGVIRHVEGTRITVGEPGGEKSSRCRALSTALMAAGLKCPVASRLRQEIWVKLLGNATFNPLSVLTGATLAAMCRDAEVRSLVRQAMQEVDAVGRALGLELPVTVEQRIAGAESVGEHKTSMLQDLEAGRPLELDATTGAVIELGARLGVATPLLRAIYACANLRGRSRAGGSV